MAQTEKVKMCGSTIFPLAQSEELILDTNEIFLWFWRVFFPLLQIKVSDFPWDLSEMWLLMQSCEIAWPPQSLSPCMLVLTAAVPPKHLHWASPELWKYRLLCACVWAHLTKWDASSSLFGVNRVYSEWLLIINSDRLHSVLINTTQSALPSRSPHFLLQISFFLNDTAETFWGLGLSPTHTEALPLISWQFIVIIPIACYWLDL